MDKRKKGGGGGVKKLSSKKGSAGYQVCEGTKCLVESSLAPLQSLALGVRQWDWEPKGGLACSELDRPRFGQLEEGWGGGELCSTPTRATQASLSISAGPGMGPRG